MFNDIRQGVLTVMRQNIDKLQTGDRVQEFYLAVEKKIATTKAGKPYLDIVLQDSTGRIPCKIWDNAVEESDKFSSGDIIKILGIVTDYKGKLQITVDKLRAAVDDDNCSPTDFHPTSASDTEEMFTKILSYIESTKDNNIRLLLGNIFNDDEISTAFKSSPAAKTIHHTYIGGLLEHTLSITEICDFLASHYKNTDRDLLLAGALLHDIGKIYELKNFDYSTEGQLVGHITIGAMTVDRKSREIENFPESLRMEIIHLILSHQGEKEWGSPVVPMTAEALLLHYADNMDAKLKIFEQAIESEIALEGDFTSRIHSMGRSFYKKQNK